jgi:excalibur calcium-binding domain-containing protein
MLRIAFVMAPLIVIAGTFSAPAASADPPYRNCTEAHADGRYNIPSNDPAYRSGLDRDGDGYACEPYKGR